MSTEATVGPARMRAASIPAPEDVDGMTTERLRSAFLVERLFEPGNMNLVYTGLDRMVIGGIVPLTDIRLPQCAEFGTASFAERREIGIMNLGASGTITVSGARYHLDLLDCLYVGMGEDDICFEASATGLAQYYLCSAPAHERYPNALMKRRQAQTESIGSAVNSSLRRISKYICPGGIESCQLVMGYTEIEPNSVWNTMPPHTHPRRSEIYLYCDLGDGIVFHFMGAPGKTRHLVVRDREAVLSPAWSIHAGAGTGPYRFIWAMAGENQDFADIDPVELAELA